MSIKQFIEGIRFNFINFFAFYIFTCCAGMWVFISVNPFPANPHLAEIRTYCGNIMLLIVGFFFGSSKSNSQKDQTIHTVIEANKTLTNDAKDKP